MVTRLGEHDISTEPQLARALAEASVHSVVVVDLSGCTFIDSTAIASLINGASAVHARNERFALVIPPEQRHVTRIAKMLRLSEFLAVHESRDAALASLEAGEAPGWRRSVLRRTSPRATAASSCEYGTFADVPRAARA